MSKIAHIIVDACRDCPYYREIARRCSKAKDENFAYRYVEDETEIPDFCPLVEFIDSSEV